MIVTVRCRYGNSPGRIPPPAGRPLIVIYSHLVKSNFVGTRRAHDAGVVTALHQATHATLQALAVSLAHLQLTASEQNVLAVLADQQVRAVGALAAATGTKSTTLTHVLDRLAQRGLLVRELDPADRRSFQVSLTGPGRRAAAAVHAAVVDVERAALRSVSDAELAGFHAVISALTNSQQTGGGR
jgi:MarR family transcriptional regulator, organic hydroperoxide resistance regulator